MYKSTLASTTCEAVTRLCGGGCRERKSLHPPSTLSPTLNSVYMSDASTLAELPFGHKENISPLPIPPRKATTNVTTPPVLVPIPPIRFI